MCSHLAFGITQLRQERDFHLRLVDLGRRRMDRSAVVDTRDYYYYAVTVMGRCGLPTLPPWLSSLREILRLWWKRIESLRVRESS